MPTCKCEKPKEIVEQTVSFLPNLRVLWCVKCRAVYGGKDLSQVKKTCQKKKRVIKPKPSSPSFIMNKQICPKFNEIKECVVNQFSDWQEETVMKPFLVITGKERTPHYIVPLATNTDNFLLLGYAAVTHEKEIREILAQMPYDKFICLFDTQDKVMMAGFHNGIVIELQICTRDTLFNINV